VVVQAEGGRRGLVAGVQTGALPILTLFCLLGASPGLASAAPPLALAPLATA